MCNATKGEVRGSAYYWLIRMMVDCLDKGAIHAWVLKVVGQTLQTAQHNTVNVHHC